VEASRLLAQIIEERQQLADDVRAAPEMIRSNSLVRDINRAMSRLESEVRHLSGRERAKPHKTEGCPAFDRPISCQTACPVGQRR